MEKNCYSQYQSQSKFLVSAWLNKCAFSFPPPSGNNLKAKEKNEWTNKTQQWWQFHTVIFIGIKRQVELLEFVQKNTKQNKKPHTQLAYLQAAKKKSLYGKKKTTAKSELPGRSPTTELSYYSYSKKMQLM